MSYSKEQYEEAMKYQDFVVHELYKAGIVVVLNSSMHYQYNEGESLSGVEIKQDCKFKETGNLYIETAEKTDEKNRNYVESGVFRGDNAWLFVIGDYENIYVFDVKMLKRINGWEATRHKETPTSQGFLVPKKWADEYCVKYLKPKGEKVNADINFWSQ